MSRHATLRRDPEALRQQIVELEASIARAVAVGAPSDGVAQAYQNLRELRVQLDLVARQPTSAERPAGPDGLSRAALRVLANLPAGGSAATIRKLGRSAGLSDGVAMRAVHALAERQLATASPVADGNRLHTQSTVWMRLAAQRSA